MLKALNHFLFMKLYWQAVSSPCVSNILVKLKKIHQRQTYLVSDNTITIDNYNF